MPEVADHRGFKKAILLRVPTIFLPNPPTRLPKMSCAEDWKSLFIAWPNGVPRRGIVTSSLNEQMPFKGFMIRGEVLLLERTNADAMGGRFILLSFTNIDSVKFIDPVKEIDMAAAGFAGKFAK